jgi:SAM-dependent methyltransferase
MSKVGEYILQRLSRQVTAEDFLNESCEKRLVDVRKHIDDLEQTFPDFRDGIEGRSVLDIGCWEGAESIAIALCGAKEVVGIDIRLDMAKANSLKRQFAPAHDIGFTTMDAARTTFPDNRFEAVVTIGSFEHFRDPFRVLEEIRRITCPGGRIYVTSSVWAHPWGAHMNFFTKVPWVQFIFSERTIMNVRNRYRHDGAQRFSDVEGGLNKIGVRRFRQYAKALRLDTEYLYVRPVNGLTLLSRLPFVNEFFTNYIVAILKKPQDSLTRSL